ncbi:MAG TPA: aconitate hydratase [Solirubrobacterales bacterium]|nr:aconitate hydratase [Solirubrobacterales bacterium]
MTADSFGARAELEVSGRTVEIHRLDALQGKFDVARLPYCLKVLLENALRLEDGTSVSSEDVEAIATWDANAKPSVEIPFQPARVLMQDFTGVPAVVDLAAMRDAMEDLGGAPSAINPQVDVDLVIDHSVQVDAFGNQKAFGINEQRDYERNGERYAFLRWGQNAFDNFRVVPPATGICHQVNLEYLGQCVYTREQDGTIQAYPDTLVGTDSHTTMINGLGVLGWGVGGIEAEAAMLGQPISMLLPQVIGFRLTGELREGATATDLVLTVTELLREKGVVSKFVEFFGPGIADLGLADRATIGNMSPEFGSTCAIFPIDAETLRYLEFTGRPTEQIELVDAYTREQGLFHEPGSEEATYSDTLELDLGEVEPSIAGPKRPQDRIAVSNAKPAFLEAMQEWDPDAGDELSNMLDVAIDESFPASDPPAEDHDGDNGKPQRAGLTAVAEERKTSDCVSVQLEDGQTVELDHGMVVIAAITSCTNTSNPSVMLGAGLIAKKAVERGLARKPWVKTSLAPGSTVVTEYLEKSGLDKYLNQLQFNLVGYGCTTCIGNSGPLPKEISEAVNDNDLVVCSVLSGNRNFEGRINPDTRANYLASPPLVVAYALAGRMDIDLTTEPLGRDSDDQPVYLSDVWPSSAEIKQVVGEAVRADMFTKSYADVFTGDKRWKGIEIPEGDRYTWPDSTYVRKPSFFEGMDPEPKPVEPIEGARVLAVLGDSVTTDHISPAGAIKKDSPAGKWLQEQGVEVRDFNSYGSRRGNHEVMIRGTFANVRLRNRLVEREGGFTKHFSSSEGQGEETTIYEAAMGYADEGVPLVVLAGKEYGSGSSRDWAAKGTNLLGVRAVIAESFERIHRSNLIGMGVLPLQFPDGESFDSLGLTGEETFDVGDLQNGEAKTVQVTARRDGGDDVTFEATVRIDTPNEVSYFQNGGILHRVLRDLRSHD